MGLDVYVGSLTRYYLGDWETVVQQYGRLEGLPVEVVRSDQPPDAVRNPDEIRGAVVEWRRQISEGIRHVLATPLEWNELDEAPYFTDKPAWDCYSALLVWAAHEEHPQFPTPTECNEDWTSDPAFQASNASGFKSRYSHLLRDVELWLPCNFEFTFKARDVTGSEVAIGSSVALLRQLQELNRRTWNANASMMELWRQEGADYLSALEIASRFAFAIFMKLTAASVEHRLPMKLDY